LQDNLEPKGDFSLHMLKCKKKTKKQTIGHWNHIEKEDSIMQLGLLVKSRTVTNPQRVRCSKCSDHKSIEKLML
jgi:hypothetical protein